MTARRCPALLVSAPASGQGKTTVTAALARKFRNQGRRVRVFKAGPDFLDPMILDRASGASVYQLDLWMCGEAHCRELLYQAAGDADFILVEGVMGLFDGTPSSADLAEKFNLPVLAVIDAGAMAQTFGAVVHGLASYRPQLRVHAAIGNRVAGDGHAALLAESLPPSLVTFGHLVRNADIALPERHLGLLQAAEIRDLETRIQSASERLQFNLDLDALTPVTFISSAAAPLPRSLAGVRIGIARDAAFSCIYRANLDVLEQLGAQLVYFSPLAQQQLPEVDSLWLPGGYPELYLRELQNNRSIADAVRAHHAAGKPIVAECGGMLYLLESLTDTSGTRADMAGLLPGHAVMQDKLANLGLHSATLPEGTLRGHTFHYSKLDTSLIPVAHSEGARAGRRDEAIYRDGRLLASYLHFYFPSNPEAVARVFAPSFS
jgi:cobyrinic acid a,c-diamide synthase